MTDAPSTPEDTVFTLDKLRHLAAKLGKPQFLAIVMSPAGQNAFTHNVPSAPTSALCPHLYGAPTYVKTRQVEPYRIFCDEGELRAYLKS